LTLSPSKKERMIEMPEKVQARIPAGMRDILPEQMLKRQYVLDVVRAVFEQFGFEPIQTPAIELSETLLGKYGDEAERLIYKAWYGDTPSDELSLRYDLSVPLCRLVATYPELPRPFKRYQIAPVWRADRPQKGRYREFFQCDADIVGSSSMLADAEIVAVVYQVLQRLGFADFTISINNRKILDGIGQYAGVPESLQSGLYRSIDKLDKIGIDGVRRELMMVGVPVEPQQPIQRVARLAIQGKVDAAGLGEALRGSDGILDDQLVDTILPAMQLLIDEAVARQVPPGELQAATAQLVGNLAPQLRAYYGAQAVVIPEQVVDRLLDLLQIEGRAYDVLEDLEQRLQDYPLAISGITELRSLFNHLDAMAIPDTAYGLSFAMVRGLEYYTGPIFETTIRKPKAMPSITGGGRYDDLIGLFGPTTYPATGISFGIERIIDAMEELEMFPPKIGRTTAQVLVTSFGEEMVGASLELATRLRQDGINTAMYYNCADRLGDQIGYASAKGIPFVIILGPDEWAAGQAAIRKLGQTSKDSEQRTARLEDVAGVIRGWQ
jgi:histidyl-tRNA synthetase